MNKKYLAFAMIATMSAATIFTACGSKSTEASDTKAATETTVEADTTDNTADASTGAAETSKDVTSEDGQFDNGTIKFSYDPEYISVFEDETTGTVTASFYNEDVQTAGSNVISITKISAADAKAYLEEKYGASEDSIMVNDFGATGMTSYSYILNSDASQGSGLQVSETYTTVQCGDDILLIDSFSTIENDEETAIMISDKLAEVLDTLEIADQN